MSMSPMEKTIEKALRENVAMLEQRIADARALLADALSLERENDDGPVKGLVRRALNTLGGYPSA